MKAVIDVEGNTKEKISAVFNDQSLKYFETKPVPSSALPCAGMFRSYSRLSGDKDLLGKWAIKVEHFYGEGADVPDNPEIDKTGQEWNDLSTEEAVEVVLNYPKPW